MNCEDARVAVTALVDGELDPVRAAEVERHLEGCAACRALRDSDLALREALRANLPYYRAPAALKERTRAGTRASFGPARSPVFRWDWGLAFAAGLVAAVLGMIYRPPAAGLERELVAAHVRSLMADHLSDVASSDRHTVKPWSDGRATSPRQ